VAPKRNFASLAVVHYPKLAQSNHHDHNSVSSTLTLHYAIPFKRNFSDPPLLQPILEALSAVGLKRKELQTDHSAVSRAFVKIVEL
jgi:hypothetical protein